MILLWTFMPLPLLTALLALGWGSLSMLQAVHTNFAGLMVLRFLIGACEAGFVPAVALYMSFFYHRGEMGLRYGLFISFSPLASCFASALAYGIVHAKTSIDNWKLLFIVGEWILDVILQSLNETEEDNSRLTFEHLNFRGLSNNYPRRCCLLLPTGLAVAVSIPDRPPERNHKPKGSKRPG